MNIVKDETTPAGASANEGSPPNSAPAPAVPDPFDPASLRLAPSMTAGLGVKKLLTTVPVRKPSKEWFVRCHPEEAYQLTTYVIELKEDNETYLVAPGLWSSLAGESTFSPRLLVTAINSVGTLFLWPIRLPNDKGRADEWNQSALAAAEQARERWVRVQANMNLGAYDVFAAAASWNDPAWPSESFQALLRIAFRDRFIDSLEHPVLKRLRGEQ